MNAALLLMSSTIAIGADPPPAAPPPAPVVAAPGPGCNGPGCGGTIASCDPCGSSRVGIFTKLKSSWGHSSSCGCDPCAPARPNLLDTLRSKFGKHHDCGCAPAPCSGCSTPLPAGAAPVVPNTTTLPDKMAPPPKPGATTPPSPGKKEASLPTIPNPDAVIIPALPVTPVSGPKFNGTNAPY